MAVWSNGLCLCSEQGKGVKTQMINWFINQTHSEIKMNLLGKIFQQVNYTFFSRIVESHRSTKLLKKFETSEVTLFCRFGWFVLYPAHLIQRKQFLKH